MTIGDHQGVRVRQSPEWNTANMCWAGAPALGDASHVPAVALLNNDDRGWVYKVYGYAIDHEGTGNVTVSFANGSPVPTFSQAQAINPSNGQPSGLACAGAITLPGSFGSELYQHNVGSVLAQYTSDWPLWEIPKGMSLVFLASANNDVLSVTFWFRISAIE